jgi:hypothetical protein
MQIAGLVKTGWLWTERSGKTLYVGRLLLSGLMERRLELRNRRLRIPSRTNMYGFCVSIRRAHDDLHARLRSETTSRHPIGDLCGRGNCIGTTHPYIRKTRNP